MGQIEILQEIIDDRNNMINKLLKEIEKSQETISKHNMLYDRQEKLLTKYTRDLEMKEELILSIISSFKGDLPHEIFLLLQEYLIKAKEEVKS